MKFVSFTRLGSRGFGAVVEGGVVDLTRRLGHRSDSLKSAIASETLAAAADYVAGRAPDFAISDITFLPVIPDPVKILCIGVNYEEHKAETQRPDVDHPTIFTRWADTLIGHRQALIKPNVSNRFDYEGEMAVIIGRGGRNITADKAMDHIAGYSIFNDGSVRDFQRHTSQFTPGKNFPATGAFGPFMVTPDEVGDYTKLPIQTRLNGEVLQSATLADLIFPIPQLIEYISTFTPLVAGDVIATGTPGGVGDKRQPPLYMRPGDLVEIEVGLLGTLVNPVMAEM
ncbi:fumarylacetoacetate hydrolase family protein [Acuticoccus kandeliae]|uniref:fumarylacetoacetate hydrolase family protein n=1 Tax=Acuticoccus kandeliae TaxID=2073160 RepID=UPI000D3E45D6|nr:fumarylacetoacetate hydrolase family protein [Acuticoccus kandeliae]